MKGLSFLNLSHEAKIIILFESYTTSFTEFCIRIRIPRINGSVHRSLAEYNSETEADPELFTDFTWNVHGTVSSP